ncbi:hypothetical protein H4582DRAFT_2080474 [Lactarius indigo]|nr:hypothetical protein H4582DRAFT_2080474 [Lactarius indigo]
MPSLHMLALTAWARAEYLLGGYRGSQQLLEAPRVCPAAVQHARVINETHGQCLVVSVMVYLEPYPLDVKHAAFLRHLPRVVQFSRLMSYQSTRASHSWCDMSFDLHALLDNVWFPCLRAHALDILAPEGPSNPCVLEALVHIRGEALRRLVVSSFESTAVLIHAVRLFPCMRWLRLIAVNYWYEQSPITRTPVHLGEWVEVLAALPARGGGIPRRVDLPRS